MHKTGQQRLDAFQIHTPKKPNQTPPPQKKTKRKRGKKKSPEKLKLHGRVTPAIRVMNSSASLTESDAESPTAGSSARCCTRGFPWEHSQERAGLCLLPRCQHRVGSSPKKSHLAGELCHAQGGMWHREGRRAHKAAVLHR